MGRITTLLTLCLRQAIFTNSGTSAGLGFAIGVDIVRRVVPQLIASGRVVRASLGIQAHMACLCRSRLSFHRSTAGK